MSNATFILDLNDAQKACASKAVSVMQTVREGNFEHLLDLFDAGEIPVSPDFQKRMAENPTYRQDVRENLGNAIAALNMRVSELAGRSLASVSQDSLPNRRQNLKDAADAFARPDADVELTFDQALETRDALDFYSRLALGQVHELYSILVDLPIVPSGHSFGYGALDRAVNDIGLAIGFVPGHSYGIGSPSVVDDGQRAYEIKKALAREIAYEIDPSPAFKGVDYDGVSVRYTKDPEPKCSTRAPLVATP